MLLLHVYLLSQSGSASSYLHLNDS